MKHTTDALDKKSYLWLEESDPELLQAIETDLKEGATPDRLYHLILRERDSRKLALCVRAAARHIASQQVSTLERYGLKE